MKLCDFFIGLEFFTTTGKWKCTDVGTRTICAISVDSKDSSWYNSSPPYALEEVVFDEDDQVGCSLDEEIVLPKEKCKTCNCLLYPGEICGCCLPYSI